MNKMTAYDLEEELETLVIDKHLYQRLNDVVKGVEIVVKDN